MEEWRGIRGLMEVVRETRVGEEALVRDLVDLGWAMDHFLGEVVLER